MHTLIVRNNTLICGSHHFQCAVGKGGVVPAEAKREGDGCTPAGTWTMRACWWRKDRMPAPITHLPLHVITPADGWCDDPTHPDYNQHVQLPHAGRHEQLHREDHVYDLVVPLGYNDAPVVLGKGSAIFFHLAHADYHPTEGCVALKMEDFLKVISVCGPSSALCIEG